MFKNVGAMSLKLHFLHSYLDIDNLGDFTIEQGVRLHQDTNTIKDRYQGKRYR